MQVHTCTLTLADAVWEGQPVPGDQHTASAGRRKAARCAAAEARSDDPVDTFLSMILHVFVLPTMHDHVGELGLLDFGM